MDAPRPARMGLHVKGVSCIRRAELFRHADIQFITLQFEHPVFAQMEHAFSLATRVHVINGIGLNCSWLHFLNLAATLNPAVAVASEASLLRV